jgi:hypothetical protein
MATSDYRNLGTSGLNRQGGRIYEEPLVALSGHRWRAIVREMSEQDAIIGAILFVAEMLIRQVEWTVQPFSDDGATTTNADGKTTQVISPEAEERAKHVDKCLHNMNNTWDDTLAEILTMLPWGFAPLEVTMKRREDRRVGWASWGIRAQDTVDEWQFDEDGNVTGIWQLAPPSYQRVLIPIEKCLLFRTTSRKGNPEGRSILRSAYRSWYMKKNIENIEGIGIERDLAGLPVAYVPPNILSSTATADETAMLASIKGIVTNIRRDEQEGVVWPLAFDDKGNKLFDLALLSTGGARSFDTDKIIGRYDQRIAMTVLADFILLGHEKVGSFSLSSDKTNLFGTALSAWLDSIAETVNRFAIPKLMKLNGWPVDQLPRLVHGDLERVSMAELADYVSKLTGSNVIVADDDLERHMRQQADLPEPGTPRKPPEPATPAKPVDPDAPADSEDDGSEDDKPKDGAEMAAMLQAAARILARGW